jgi:hypothetical protein
MTLKYWRDLSPSILVAVGIVVSTFIAARAAGSGWLVLTGPLLLALAVVGADVLNARLRGASSAPSWAALFMGGSCLLAGLIVTRRDPTLVKTLMPIIGMAAWVTVLRPESGSKACRNI